MTETITPQDQEDSFGDNSSYSFGNGFGFGSENGYNYNSPTLGFNL